MVYDIIFGGNTLVDCKGKVYAIDAGTEESIMFCEDKDGNVLLNCTVKDKYGDILVKVDNGSVIYVDDRYNLKKENDSIIVNKDNGVILLEFKKVGSNNFKLNGNFFIRGHWIIVTDEYLDINNRQISNNLYNQPKIFMLIESDGSIRMGY